MLKSMVIRGQYYWHLFQHHHNELLVNECLCEELKSKFRVKAIYHNSKVIELASLSNGS